MSAINEMKETLEQERKTYKDGGYQDDIILGWIEALEYSIKLLEEENK
tara:strand:- start:275 stop:418 length:144 start_codon:yes stop_codon:yes gene_type:complete